MCLKRTGNNKIIYATATRVTATSLDSVFGGD